MPRRCATRAAAARAGPSEWLCSAAALHSGFERLSRIARSVGAYFMVDMAHYAGLVASGRFAPKPARRVWDQSPIPAVSRLAYA
ncbi:hypothetical protein NH14_018280 [Paraburkholderia sacchari]|uniref:Serine hydroxymethyltransferase-like domain-containing protein n=1 Tax=Paraburkholderia sacchari TaxID=159450 RepID=A0A8T6ZER5_9BURK|nr:hypothetical protein [Paraburkholderia sacchari]